LLNAQLERLIKYLPKPIPELSLEKSHSAQFIRCKDWIEKIGSITAAVNCDLEVAFQAKITFPWVGST
jgi:hypothetical protein